MQAHDRLAALGAKYQRLAANASNNRQQSLQRRARFYHNKRQELLRKLSLASLAKLSQPS